MTRQSLSSLTPHRPLTPHHSPLTRPQDIDELFSEWDADGGGSITYKELQKILKPTSPGIKGMVKGKAALAVAALGNKG